VQLPIAQDWGRDAPPKFSEAGEHEVGSNEDLQNTKILRVKYLQQFFTYTTVGLQSEIFACATNHSVFHQVGNQLWQVIEQHKRWGANSQVR